MYKQLRNYFAGQVWERWTSWETEVQLIKQDTKFWRRRRRAAARHTHHATANTRLEGGGEHFHQQVVAGGGSLLRGSYHESRWQPRGPSAAVEDQE
jgi:hypothetical protein